MSDITLNAQTNDINFSIDRTGDGLTSSGVIDATSMQNFLNVLGQAMNGTWNMSYNIQTGKYTFEFSPITSMYVETNFADLPQDVNTGSEGVFSKEDGIGVAIKFDDYWEDSDGNKLYV